MDVDPSGPVGGTNGLPPPNIQSMSFATALPGTLFALGMVVPVDHIYGDMTEGTTSSTLGIEDVGQNTLLFAVMLGWAAEPGRAAPLFA